MAEVYGKYRLIDCISETRVAGVFRAKSHGVEGFEKVVVIKRLSWNTVRVPGFIEAFIEEAKTAVKLSHANLVQVFDLGQVERSFYMAMEHVNGPDLGQLTDRLRVLRIKLPTDLAIHLVCEVVKALDYMHRRKDHQLRQLNLVHGGVHPWNILISTDGEVKLNHFGALRLQGLLPPTLRPPSEAWAPFLPPELVATLSSGPQAMSLATQGADTFMAGVVLLELLTGRLPAGPAEAEQLIASLAGVPPKLPDLLRRTLQPDPGQRFGRAGELYEELVALLFHAGLKPSNRALGIFVADLMRRPLPEGFRYAPREVPLAGPALTPPGPMPAVPSQGGAAPPPRVKPPPPPPQAAQAMHPMMPPTGPRRAPVVTSDPVHAIPALSEGQHASLAGAGHPAVLQANPPAHPSALPPAAHFSFAETARLGEPIRRSKEPTAEEVAPEMGRAEPPPGSQAASTREGPAHAPVLPPPLPPEDAGGSEPTITPLAPLPHETVQPIERAIVREIAILYIRAVGYVSQVTLGEVRTIIDRWGGRSLPSAGGTATVIFFSASLPARAMMRALHAGLQLVEPLDDLARYAVGVHAGSARLVGDAGSLAAAEDDPVFRRARDLALAANPGELLCSDAGPLLLGTEFAFSPPLRIRDELVAHRVASHLTVTTQRAGFVSESMHTQVGRGQIPGREAEIQAILALIDEVRSGQGRILALEGAAGIGKSSLVEGVRRALDAPELAWYHVRLFGGFEQVPYWGLRSLLGTICAVEEEHQATEVRNRLDRLVQLGLNLDELSGVASIFALQRKSSSRQRLAPSVHQLISSDSRALLAGMLHKVVARLAAERPLVLVLEDLEHLDEETWRLLRDLSGPIAAWPVLIWLTSRVSIPLPSSPHVLQLTLGPLSRESLSMRIRRIARLYGEVELRDDQLALLHQLGADNPRHVEELVRYAGEQGWLTDLRPELDWPPTLAELVTRRLAGLPEVELDVLRTASVIGQLFGIGLLSRVIRLDRLVVEEALLQAQRRGFVEPISTGLFAFRFTELPAALYGQLPADKAEALHQRIAAQLEAFHPEDRARFLEELAHHYSKAGSSEKALKYLEALADRMEAGHHYRAAISHMQAAAFLLEQDPRGDIRQRIEVLMRLGQLAIPALELEMGRQALHTALNLAQQIHQERKIAQSLFLLGRSWLAEGKFDEALSQLERALKLGQGLRDRLLMAGIYGAIGETYYKNGNLQRALDYLARGSGLADRGGDAALAGRLLLMQANCSAGQGNFIAADRALDKAHQVAGRINDPEMQLAVLKARSLVEFFRKDYAASLRACLEGAEVAQAIGNVTEEVIFLHNAGDCCLHQGDLPRAHHYLNLSQDICSARGLTRTQLTNSILLSYLEAVRAHTHHNPVSRDSAMQQLEADLASAHQLHLTWEEIQAHLYLGLVQALLGRKDAARENLTAAAQEAGRIKLQFAQLEAEDALARL